jgi:hypothetical protein
MKYFIINIISLIILSASFYSIWLQYRFFSMQKRKCQKYPFFRLRDKIILSIVQSEDSKSNLEIYKHVNGIIEKLKFLSFSFYSEALTVYFGKIIEDVYRNNSSFCPSSAAKLSEVTITEFEKEFIYLIIHTAKENSLALRLSMSKIGYRLLVTSSLIKALKRFLANNPEMLAKKRKKLATMRDYSRLNHFAEQMA